MDAFGGRSHLEAAARSEAQGRLAHRQGEVPELAGGPDHGPQTSGRSTAAGPCLPPKATLPTAGQVLEGQDSSGPGIRQRLPALAGTFCQGSEPHISCGKRVVLPWWQPVS